MRESIYNKIRTIDNDISIKTSNMNKISLFNGLGALPIFYFLMYELTKKTYYIDKIHKSLERIIEILNSSDFSHTYCDGLIGIAQMFHYIKNKKILSDEYYKEIEDSLIYIDKAIIDISLISTNDFVDTDFLHGSFGAAFYLNQRLSENQDVNFRNQVIQLFERLSTLVLEDIKKTESVSELLNYDKDTHRTNCGLAHGNISHIIIFSKFIDNFPKNHLVKEALLKSVECLLSFEKENENGYSQFPSIAINKLTAQYEVPLGWCYGDQSISLGLHKASIVLNDESIKKKALNLAYKNLARNIIEKVFPTLKYDACFCHGLSSVAYIHKKWYMISKDIAFYKEYEKYIEYIIHYGINDEEVKGYQKYIGKSKYADAIGFLDGTIGIGIVLIDYLLDLDTGWDNFFLLDINN